MRTSLLLLPLLLSGSAPVLGQDRPDTPIDAFEAERPWSAIGRATSAIDPNGHAGACMHLRFGVESDASFAIVQGPNDLASAAWEAGVPPGTNAFVLQARASRPIDLQIVLRVRERGVAGPQGVRGHLRASLQITSAEWQPYAVPFAAFSGDPGVGTVGDRLFRTFHPQPQFHAAVAPGTGAVDVWVDELAFGITTQAVLPEAAVPRPGLDALDRVVAIGKALTEPPVDLPGAPRSAADLRDGWVFVPWLESTQSLGEPQSVSLPHGWPGGRQFSSGWYLRRLNVPAAPVGPVRLHCRRVAFWSALFVDGVAMGEHAGGFTPFSFDIGRQLSPGEHLLALYVQDSTAALMGDRAVLQLGVMRPGRGFARGGVFDRIELQTLPAVFVDDTAVTTSVAERRLRLVCELRNGGAGAVSGTVRVSVRDWRTGEPAAVAVPEGAFRLGPQGTTTVSLEAPWEAPNLWSPEQPHLYVARVELVRGGEVLDAAEQRFGFREFRAVGREFHLNGVPIRLRGESNLHGHNAPVGLNREWLRTVFRAYRAAFGVNAFRAHAAIGHETVFEVADEEGFLMINQSAIWSAMGSHYRRGGAAFMANTEKEFAEWVRRDRNHPSVVIWDSENEMIRGSGKRDNLEWVLQLDTFIRRWDATRPISHSGAGWFAPDQDLIHVHMEEHYTRLFELWRAAPPKPLINGEYWVGGRGEFRLPSSLEVASQEEFWAEEARLYHQFILEQRAAGVAGIMPFTIRRTAFLPLFSGPPPAVPPAPEDPDPRPRQADPLFNPGWIGDAPAYRLRPGVAPLLRHALAPVTAFFWPRHEAAAGPTVARQLVVCNDRESPQTVRLAWGVVNGERHEDAVLLPAAGIHRRTVHLRLTDGADGDSLYAEAWTDTDDATRDELPQRRLAPAAPTGTPAARRVFLTDRGGVTRQALEDLGIAAVDTDQPPAEAGSAVWVIGAGSADRALDAQAGAIHRYLAAGGRILCLAQPRLPAWVPVRLNLWSAVRATPEAFAEGGWQDGWRGIYYSRHAPVYAAGHPAFAGLRHDLRWWNAVDGRVSDDSLARPTATGAVAQGAWRALAGGTRRENIGMAEVFVESGVLLLCWFHVDGETGRNPEAARLLANSVTYLAAAAPARGNFRVVALGAGLAQQLRRLTGAEIETVEAVPDDGDPSWLLLAGPGAPPDALAAWAARSGGTVLILAAETAAGLPGMTLERRDGFTYGASRGADHPLFWGLASCSFEDMERPAVKGALTAWPEGARVLLRGRRAPTPLATRGDLDIGHGGAIALDAAGAAAVELRAGRGTLIATTLEPFNPESPHSAEILGHLLTNAGLDLPAPARTAPRLRALRTVPLRLDGRLDDWTNDTEDRNVSPYRHAEPVVLAAESAVAGEGSGDRELSAILYVLWDETRLYLGGAVVGRDAADRQVLVQVGEAAIRVAVGSETRPAAVSVPAGDSTADVFAGELPDVRALTDARFLTFAEIDGRVGNVRAVRGAVPARTFEMAIPWRQLGMTPTGSVPFAAELQAASGLRLRLPATPDPADRGALVFAK